MDRQVTVVSTLLAVLALAFSAGAPAQKLAGKEVRIGLVVPVTGQAADVGKREAIGAHAAADVINAKGGVGGVPIKLYFADEGTNPQEAIGAVRKVAGDDKVLAIVGPHYSGTAEATFPLGNRLKIVQVAVASSKPGVAKANRPYAFRNTLTEDKIADAVVKAAKQRYGLKRVAIISDTKDAVARSLGMGVLPAALQANGVEIVTGKDPVTFQNGDAQFTAQVTRLKSLKPDAIGLGALGPDALNIILEARKQGMTQPFFGTAPLMEGNLPERGGKAVNGIFAGSIWDVTQDDPASRQFKAAYAVRAKTMYPGAFTQNPDYYAVNAYDAVFMMVEAMLKNGVQNRTDTLEADRDRIKDYFAKLRNFKGVASKAFNDDGDGVKEVIVTEARDGRWRPVGSR
ncbi:MAG: ABC transporter substrate-binding protein [Betaproteobacteria bacterium]|nr:ABC transporter substrate-binding protein [Betaproteobacteria bacterium]